MGQATALPPAAYPLQPAAAAHLVGALSTPISLEEVHNGLRRSATVVVVVGMAYRQSCCAMPKLSPPHMCWRLS